MSRAFELYVVFEEIRYDYVQYKKKLIPRKTISIRKMAKQCTKTYRGRKLLLGSPRRDIELQRPSYNSHVVEYKFYGIRLYTDKDDGTDDAKYEIPNQGVLLLNTWYFDENRNFQFMVPSLTRMSVVENSFKQRAIAIQNFRLHQSHKSHESHRSTVLDSDATLLDNDATIIFTTDSDASSGSSDDSNATVLFTK